MVRAHNLKDILTIKLNFNHEVLFAVSMAIPFAFLSPDSYPRYLLLRTSVLTSETNFELQLKP